VAEDQPHVLITIQYLLESQANVKVITASNGRDAIDLAVKHRPALVLLDIMMPEVDGYTACRAIRQGWGGHPGRIWFLTARSSHMDRNQAQEVGGERFITKPFDPDELVALVQRELGTAGPSTAAA
jgi:DNA-binding response OmpR family regulator